MSPARHCRRCKTRLSWKLRADAIYCSSACRQRAYRERADSPREVSRQPAKWWPGGPLYYLPSTAPALHRVRTIYDVEYQVDTHCRRCRRSIREGIVLGPSRMGDASELGPFCGKECVRDVVHAREA